MDFKTFFVKKILMVFFISVPCITVAMAVIGMVFEPAALFGYEAFLSPLLFGLVASLPLLVKYSKNELPIRQAVVRDVLHLVLLEAVILSILSYEGLLTDMFMVVSLGASIILIDLTVNLIVWIQDKRSADEFNSALRKLQNDVQSGK